MNRQRNELIKRLRSESIETDWGPSPVEIWKSQSSTPWEGDISNFRRQKISSGAINPPDRPKSTLEEPYPDERLMRRIINTISLVNFLIRLEVHSLRTSGTLFRYIPEFGANKFRKFSIAKNFFSDIGIRMSYYSHKIRKMKLENPVILEIGAGYGALPYYLSGNYKTYFIVDLVENLILASEFLSDSKINFGTISDIANEDTSVFLLTGGDVQTLQKVDIVINTMSMQHMTNKNLKYYFQQIDRLSPKVIYLVNRNIKRDPTDIEIQNYPITNGYFCSKSNKIYSNNYSEMVFKRI